MTQARRTPSVLFSLYPSNRWSPGGKERIVRDLHAELTAMGESVTLHDPWAFEDATPHDVLHLFGSEYYQYEMLVRAKAQGMRVVLHSILVFADRKAERMVRPARVLSALTPLTTTWKLRALTLRGADRVVCMTDHEAELVRSRFGVQDAAIVRIPASVPTHFYEATRDRFVEKYGIRDFVLCVGRIEPRKNTLAVVRAARRAGVRVVLIGAIDRSHAEYAAAVDRELRADDQILHIPRIANSDPLLGSAFAAARAHVLASFHEQLGFVNLEAALAGTRVITSDVPGVREYLGDFAILVDPENVDDIARAIERAADLPRDEAYRRRILERYGTPVVAKKLMDLYRSLAP